MASSCPSLDIRLLFDFLFVGLGHLSGPPRLPLRPTQGDDRKQSRQHEHPDFVDTPIVRKCEHQAERINRPSVVRATIRRSIAYWERTASRPKSASARSWASTTPR